MSTYPATDMTALDRSEEAVVHEWRRERLESLGLPEGLAQWFADCVDWHLIADLVDRGCPPLLALAIAW
jgi:hypothetical protein